MIYSTISLAIKGALQMNHMTQMTDQELDDLVIRVLPLLDAVDLDNLPKDVRDALTVGAMSGREQSTLDKQMLAIEEAGHITADEYQALVFKFARDGDP